MKTHTMMYILKILGVLEFVIFFSPDFTGWGPLIWCITSVIFPPRVKAVACGLCASFMWFMTFVLTSTFQAIDPAVDFFIFGCATFISCFFIRFHLPETKGKSLLEIQDMIQGQHTPEKNHCTPL